MNRRLLSVVTFALLVAGAASALVYKLIVSHVQAPAGKQEVQATKLVVAAHDLQVGALIADGDLDEVSWTGPLPDEVVANRQDLVGRGVIANIFKHEPILGKRLAPKGAGAGLAATIPVGKRAVALRVNDVVGLAGFVLPGMRVDVLIAGNAPGSDPHGVRCKTILQNIEVLSAGQKIEKSLDGKPETAEVVNLLVTPDQAEVLNLASSETKVQLVLRNPLDTHEESTKGTSVAVLFGVNPQTEPVHIAKVFEPRATPSPLPSVEVYTGVKRTDQVLGGPAGESKQ
jgi:pilus assembly protein CpaB